MSEAWSVVFLPEAREDINELDNAIRRQVDKAISKVSHNPLPRYRGGYGDPLSNQDDAQLAGLCKIKLKKAGVRVVYKAIELDDEMVVIVVGARADNEVYREAAKRKQVHGL